VALRERVVAAVPSRRSAWLLGALVLAFIGLTALVAAGVFTRVDQFSVDHFMPWLRPSGKSPDTTVGFYRPFPMDVSGWTKALELWTYPCSLLVSGLVVVLAGVVLWRRYGPVVGLLPAAAWIVGNGIEVIGKGTITRPALYGDVHGVPVHIVAYDNSFPSGHMIRGMVVAFSIALVWTRASRWAALWAVLVAPALLLQSAHTLTDVVGGILVGAIVLVLAEGVLASEGHERG
jgi:membrane-associated phospholipid phosphatase